MSQQGFLLFSHYHGLVPLANRLSKEGRSVEVLAWNDRYSRAWAGKLKPVLSNEEKRKGASEQTAHLQKLLDWGEVILVADSEHALRRFPTAKHRLVTHSAEAPPPVRLGGWFDGEQIVAPHLLVEDRGAWPGGMGPQVAGGMTLIRIAPDRTWFLDAFAKATDEAKSADHRGLVQVVGELGPEGAVRYERVVMGFHGLHLHAFLAALGEEQLVGTILAGEAAPHFPRRVAVTLPVTVPPWPNGGAAQHESALVRFEWPGREPEEAKALSQLAFGQVAWHDVRVDAKARRLFVAGLDGLVGVARGTGDSVLLARGRALELAGALVLPEKQYRPDVAGGVEEVLARLEAAGIEV